MLKRFETWSEVGALNRIQHEERQKSTFIAYAKNWSRSKAFPSSIFVCFQILRTGSSEKMDDGKAREQRYSKSGLF